MLKQALTSRRDELEGRLASPQEIEELKARLGELVPDWLVDVLLTYPLIECAFSLNRNADKSGVGVEMEWLSPAKMIHEAFEAYPGLVAHPKGYLPIGSCELGSGDYYYIRPAGKLDPPLLRVPHEAVDLDKNELIEADVEEVCENLSQFVRAGPNHALPSDMTTQTALVTGASAGIGLEIAKELARKRIDLVLVARRQDKLEELAALLSPHVKVTVLAFDLSLPDAPQQLFDALKDQRIDILVNNAGFADSGLFAQSDSETMAAMLEVNVVALTKLTRLFLPPMLERGSGRIMNVSSIAAYFPGPLMSVYYASKAYVQSFSEALRNEVEGTGVTVTSLCPGPTASEFQSVAKMQRSPGDESVYMSAKEVARKGVRAMLRGEGTYIPGWRNRLITLTPRLMSRGALARIIRRVQEH